MEMAESESAYQSDFNCDDKDEVERIKDEVKEEVDSDQESQGFPFDDDQIVESDEKSVEQKISYAVDIRIRVVENYENGQQNEDGQQRKSGVNMKVTKKNVENKKSYQKLKEKSEKYAARLVARRENYKKRREKRTKLNRNCDEEKTEVTKQERKKAKNKKSYQKLKEDPEKYAKTLAARRENYRKKRGRSLKRNCDEEESCNPDEVKTEVTKQQRKSARDKKSYQKLKNDPNKYAATLAANRENYRKRKERSRMTKKVKYDEEPSCDGDETNAPMQEEIEIKMDRKKTFKKHFKYDREKYRKEKQTQLEKLNAMTDSERELFLSEQKQRMALRKIERLANMTEEEKEEQRQKNILRYYEKKATMTAEQLEKIRRKSRAYAQRQKELGIKKKNLAYREIAQKQTTEQRQKSLRQYRINNEKHSIKRELMNEGLSPEEIQEKLVERLQEFESKLNQKKVAVKPYKPKGGRLFKIIKTSDDDFTIKFLGSSNSDLYNARSVLRKKFRLEGMSDKDIEQKLEEMVNDYNNSNPDALKTLPSSKKLKPRLEKGQRPYDVIGRKQYYKRRVIAEGGNLTSSEIEKRVQELMEAPKYQVQISLKPRGINKQHKGETPEQRTERLKRLSIYVKRRQLRKKIEKEGKTTSEEMETKIENLLKEWVESNPKFRGSSNNISFKEERKRKPKKKSGSVGIAHHVNFPHAPQAERIDMTPSARETAHYPTDTTVARASYSSCSSAIEIEEESTSVSKSSPVHSYSGDYYSGQNEDYNDDERADNDPASPPSSIPIFQELKTEERRSQSQHDSSSFDEILFQNEIKNKVDHPHPVPPPSSALIPSVSTEVSVRPTTDNLNDASQMDKPAKKSSNVEGKRYRISVRKTGVPRVAKIELQDSAKQNAICDICGNAYESSYISLHKQMVHNPNFQDSKCQLCGLEFREAKEWLAHYRIAHLNVTSRRKLVRPSRPRVLEGGSMPKEGHIMCEICGNSYSSQVMYTHMKVAHHPNFQDGRCVLCGETFTSGVKWLAHYRKVHRDHNTEEKNAKSKARLSSGSLQCAHCPASFPDKQKLHNHTYLKHGKAKEEKICHLCGKTGNHVQMSKHMKAEHPTDYSVKCPLCVEVMWSRQQLNKHLLQCHKESSFPCDYCSSVLLSAMAVRYHLCSCRRVGRERFVELEKEWRQKGVDYPRFFMVKCDICEKEVNLTCLWAHVTKLHNLKENDWNCVECGRQFKKRVEYFVHLESIHKWKVEAALEVCGKANVTNIEKVKMEFKKLGGSQVGRMTNGKRKIRKRETSESEAIETDEEETESHSEKESKKAIKKPTIKRGQGRPRKVDNQMEINDENDVNVKKEVVTDEEDFVPDSEDDCKEKIHVTFIIK